MKLEIKYRGKSIDNGEWVYGSALVSDTLSSIIIINHAIDKLWAINSVNVIPESISQFVGLKDKNGKDIYEKDIVSHKYRRVWQTEIHISKVVWNQEYCCFYLYDGVSNHRMRDDIIYEVMDNIIDNPSFLKKEETGTLKISISEKAIKIKDSWIIISDDEIKYGDFITDGYKVWKWMDDCSLLGRKKVIDTVKQSQTIISI